MTELGKLRVLPLVMVFSVLFLWEVGRPAPRRVRSFQVADSEWMVTEIREGADGGPSYSMEVDSQEGDATLSITCRDGVFDVFVETSNPVLARYSPGYPRYTTPVRLGFDPAELGNDSRLFRRPGGLGFWLYDERGSGLFESPLAAATGLSLQTSLVVRYQANGGGQRTTRFNLAALGRSFDRVAQACGGGPPLVAGEMLVSRFDSGPARSDPGLRDGQASSPRVGGGHDPALNRDGTGAYQPTAVFGLWMGRTLEEIEAETGSRPEALPDQPYVYFLPAVPTPDPEMEVYLVSLGPMPEGQLSEIRAVGRLIVSGADGTGVKTRFQRLAETIDTTFGLQRRLVNRQLEASTDWMVELLRKERSLGAEWTPGTAATPGSGLARIRLTVRAETGTSARLVVQFTFTNYQAP